MRAIVEGEPGRSVPFERWHELYTDLHAPIDVATLGFTSFKALWSHAGLRQVNEPGGRRRLELQNAVLRTAAEAARNASSEGAPMQQGEGDEVVTEPSNAVLSQPCPPGRRWNKAQQRFVQDLKFKKKQNRKLARMPEDEEALAVLDPRSLAALIGTDAAGLTADEMRAKLRRRILGVE